MANNTNKLNNAIEKSFKQMITTGNPNNLQKYVRKDLRSNVIAYYESVTECILSVLESTFPNVFKYLGREKARFLMMDYIRDGNMPDSGDMRYYGKDLAKWVVDSGSNSQKSETTNDHILQEIFAYDFTINEITYANDYQPIDRNYFLDLCDEDYENLVLEFPESFRLIALTKDAFNIINDIKDDIRNNQNKAQEGKKSSKEIYLTINRPYMDINVYEIRRDEYLFLQALIAGKTFASAYEMVNDCYPDFNVEQILLNGLQQGYFSKAINTRNQQKEGVANV